METTFTVNNGSRQFDQTSCPPGILPAVERAIKRGRETSGTVVGGGLLWHWQQTFPVEQPVHLEFTRSGNVVEQYDIPLIDWQAFCLVAARNGKSGAEYLQLILATNLEDQTIGETIHWLFTPGETDEIRRFRQAQAEFHGEEVTPPSFSGRRIE